MKKLFLFTVALLTSLMVGATTYTLEPGEKKIEAVKETLVDGDVIELQTGTYTEWNSLTFNTKVTIKAAEGATPIVKINKWIITKDFEANGIEFTNLGTDYMLRTGGDVAGVITVKNCTMSNEGASPFIYLSSNSVGSLVIDNCIFKDNAKIQGAVVTAESSPITNFTMTNTTVYNCGSTGDLEVYLAKCENALVDHCTFYNCAKRPLYINGSSLVSCVVKNCVISSSTATGNYCIATYAGTVDNCVYYNTSAPRSSSPVVVTNCINADPQFVDPENGNLNFAFTSPLFLAATDGTHIGDPRWGVAEPETAIAVPDTLPAMQAVLSGTKISATEDGIKWNDNSANPDDNSASWVIDVNKTGIYKLIINDTTGSGHTYIVSVANAEGWLYTKTQTENAYTKGNHVFDAIIFNEVGKYMVCLKNGTQYSSSVANKIYLDYLGGAVVDVPGTLPNEDAILGGNAKVKVDEEGYICFSGDGNVPNCFAKWNANFTKKGEFGVSINVATTNGHKYKVQVLKGEAVVGEAEEPSQVNTQGEIILKGNIKLQEAGTYTIKLINQTAHSEARVKDITFTYSGGAVVNIPATLLPADAMLSEKAFIDNDTIIFAPRGAEGYTPDGWAKWNVTLEEDALCSFKANCHKFSGNTMKIKISVINSENDTIYQKEENVENNGDSEVALGNIMLPAGDYVIQMQNTTQYSKGRLMSVVVEGSPILVITDDSDIDFTDYAGQMVTVQLMRTFKANMWNPICLPFGVEHSKLQSILNCETSYLLDEASLENQKLFVKLAASQYNDIYNGSPYMIKPSEDVENPIFENVKIMETPHATATEKGPLTLRGSFESKELDNPSHILLVGANNTLFFPSDEHPYIKSMRAYFILKDVEPNQMPRFAAFVEPGNAPTEMIIVGGEAERQKGHRKVLVDGQIRIQHEGKCYSILGLEH